METKEEYRMKVWNKPVIAELTVGFTAGGTVGWENDDIEVVVNNQIGKGFLSKPTP
jgi:hypothetical protein